MTQLAEGIFSGARALIFFESLQNDDPKKGICSTDVMSASPVSQFSRQGTSSSADTENHYRNEPQAPDFSQTLGTALSKFGRGASCETTSCGKEASHDGASSQGWVSVTDSLVLAGKTTVMVKNVPVKYTQRKLLREFLAAGFHGKLDFIYLPIDPRSRCSRGFAFCNFSSPEVTQQFFSTFHKKFLNAFESELPLEVAAAEIQGFEANAEHYLVVKASRKVKGRDTFGCPTFLRPLPQQFLRHLREAGAAEDLGHDVPEVRPVGLRRPQRQMPVPVSRPNASPVPEPKPAAPMPMQAIEAELHMAHCASCNQTIPNNAFCPYCGSVNQTLHSRAPFRDLRGPSQLSQSSVPLVSSTLLGKSFWI